MNAIMVGKPDANASVTMAPEADQVKISICPGVSTMMYFRGGSRGFSQRLITCVNRLGMAQERTCHGAIPNSEGMILQLPRCVKLLYHMHVFVLSINAPDMHHVHQSQLQEGRMNLLLQAMLTPSVAGLHG